MAQFRDRRRPKWILVAIWLEEILGATGVTKVGRSARIHPFEELLPLVDRAMKPSIRSSRVGFGSFGEVDVGLGKPVSVNRLKREYIGVNILKLLFWLVTGWSHTTAASPRSISHGAVCY